MTAHVYLLQNDFKISFKHLKRADNGEETNNDMHKSMMHMVLFFKSAFEQDTEFLLAAGPSLNLLLKRRKTELGF